MRNAVAALIGLILIASLGAGVAHPAPVVAVTPELLRRADALWLEKSYARALPIYQQALQDKRLPAWQRQELSFRVAVALGKTNQWDRAVDAGETLLTQTTGKARVLYWLARLYQEMPHQGFRVGGKVYRGWDYPTTSHVTERPVYVYLVQEDAARVLDYLQRAKVAAQAERAASSYPSLSRADEINLNFDLAAYLPSQELQKLITALDKKEKLESNVDLRQIYDTQWSLPRKVLYLYNEIARLDNTPNRHPTVLSVIAKGLFVQSYRQTMDNWAQHYDRKTKKYVKWRYPFDYLQPIAIWHQVLTQYATDSDAARAELLIARAYEQQGDPAHALIAYRTLLMKFPKTKWVSDAQAGLQQIPHRELGVDTIGLQVPGMPAHLRLTTRNVRRVAISLYPVRLESVLAASSRLQNPKVAFTDFQRNFSGIDGARRIAGRPVAAWTVNVPDKGDYKAVSETIATPARNLGAYVVVVQATDGTARTPRLRTGSLLIVSNLAILKKADRKGTLIYVANARTGKPVAGARVVVKQVYEYYGNHGPRYRVAVASGATDAQGFFQSAHSRRGEEYSQGIQVFAWSGSRYALTSNGYSSEYGDYGSAGDDTRVYSYTDRPVYRPGQQVDYRQIYLRRVKGGDFQPARGVLLRVTVANPKGETIFNQASRTSEFGTVNGSFKVPTESPLGQYAVSITEVRWPPPKKANEPSELYRGQSRFRVEEYKRPEFAVKVEPPDHAVRPGEPLTAKVNLQYYFGSPVPNAKVKYTVRRSQWYAAYQFPQPYDWFYQSADNGNYATGRRNIGGEGSGTVIKEGTSTTDDKGNAEVTFEAVAPPAEPTRTLPTLNDGESEDDEIETNNYLNPLYTIEVEATDASRRTIEGQGTVRVAGQQYFAFLNARRGYYLQGDRIQFELVTQDANDKPVAEAGKMVVYRTLPDNKDERVMAADVRTDDKGRAFWTWEAVKPGTYRVAYEGTDQWGKKVRASYDVWVGGPGLNVAQFRLRGVTILLEKRNYVEGDTLKALLVADQPDATVLFTQEVGNDILRRELIAIPGKSREITIPIRHEHIPNFFLSAALIRNYEVFQAQQEVFVPPARQFINVSVQGDKPEYKPGEKGKFTIKATDWKGRPARAEVSLALLDASLYYIQKDYAPDLRLFYYQGRRYNSLQLDSHRSGTLEPEIDDAAKLKNYDMHWNIVPDGLGMLGLTPGIGYGLETLSYMYGDGHVAWLRGRAIGGPTTVAGMPASNVTFAEGGEVSESRSVAARMKAVAPPASPAADVTVSQLAPAAGRNGVAAGPGPQFAPEVVRTNFAETAYWSPAVVTNGGHATVQVTFPDSLTQWHATARGLTNTAQVGSAEADTETRKNLLVRMQAPRFFVQRDQAVLTANVHNYLAHDKRVRVSLNISGNLRLAASAGQGIDGEVLSSPSGDIDVKAGDEARINWVVDVVKDGRASLQMDARTDEESDGVRMSFPVVVHGIERTVSRAGVLREGTGQNREVVTIDVPAQRRGGATRLAVRLNPSLAATMLDALPYLMDYPYGCVEQTMSRFLPSVMVNKVLRDSGVDLETLRKRSKAYEADARQKPLGARIQNSGYTYPQGMPDSRDLSEMASHLWYTERRANNPIFDHDTLVEMIHRGLRRLYNAQKGNGGWGWWPGSEDESDLYMSAYVVYGLATATNAGVSVDQSALQRGYSYLEGRLKHEDDVELLTWMDLALSYRHQPPSPQNIAVLTKLFNQREHLSTYSQALLALALYNFGDRTRAGVMVRNMENTVVADTANGTARWRMGSRWWCWWNNDVETNAWALQAFLRVDPHNRLVPMMVKWLTLQARGNHWESTKSTAMAVYALADYIRVNKELNVDYTLTVNLNGKLQRTYHVNSENALYFDNRFITNDMFLQNGPNTITIEKQGRGNVYWTASLEYFSLEEPIKATSHEIAVQRHYYKLTRNPALVPEQQEGVPTPTPVVDEASPTPTTPPEYLRTELKDGDAVQSGDTIEVELIVDAANDYSYLIFEDMKAAGMEPVDLRSGESWADGLSSNVELRDEKVAFFVDNLPQGRRVLRYQVRAEMPGQLHALPTNAYAMYAPEVRAISDEQRFGVHD
jgi:hypothetical protein